jgi:hypothetical protein
MNRQWPNQAAPVNAPIASAFQFGHLWRRVTEQHGQTALRVWHNQTLQTYYGATFVGVDVRRHRST